MIILDTNVISELMKARPAPQVSAWVANLPGAELFTTAINQAEILYGIEMLDKGKRRDVLLALAEDMFSEDFAGRVLGFGTDAPRAFSRIAADRRSLGRPISHADAQIAAIARTHRATLATRNIADFSDCAIKVVNPWDDG
jgi:predicted nucleic acid-binding protein